MSDVIQRNSALHRKLAGIHEVNVQGGFEGQSVPAPAGGRVLPPAPVPIAPVSPAEQARLEALYAQEHGRPPALNQEPLPDYNPEGNNPRLPAIPDRRPAATDDEGRALATHFEQQPLDTQAGALQPARGAPLHVVEDPEPATRLPVRQRRERQPGESHIMPTPPAPVQLGGAPSGFTSIDLVNAVVVADNGQTYPFHVANLKMLNKFAFDVAAQAMQQQFAQLAEGLGIATPEEATDDGDDAEVPEVSPPEGTDELRNAPIGDAEEDVQPVQEPNPRGKSGKKKV